MNKSKPATNGHAPADLKSNLDLAWAKRGGSGILNRALSGISA